MRGKKDLKSAKAKKAIYSSCRKEISSLGLIEYTEMHCLLVWHEIL